MNERKVELIDAVKTPENKIILDTEGFVVITVHDGVVDVEHYGNVTRDDRIISGTIRLVVRGTNAAAICDTFALHVRNLRQEHYLYIGREVQRACDALASGIPFEQDGC